MNVHLQIMECSIGITNMATWATKIHNFEDIRIIKYISVLTSGTCGILNTIIIGPYFFIDNILNSERYLHFLQFVLPDFIHEPLQTRQNLKYFQQDGAPTHNARIVTHYL